MGLFSSWDRNHHSLTLPNLRHHQNAPSSLRKTTYYFCYKWTCSDTLASALGSRRMTPFSRSLALPPPSRSQTISDSLSDLGSHRTEGWKTSSISPPSQTPTFLSARPGPEHSPPPQRQARHRVTANPSAPHHLPPAQRQLRCRNWIIRGILGRIDSSLDL